MHRAEVSAHQSADGSAAQGGNSKKRRRRRKKPSHNRAATWKMIL